jgi:hypothetical protein
LADLLDEDGVVLVHPFIIGELVMGGMADREEALVRRLPVARRIADEEVLAMVKQRHLASRRIGWIDAHLLASALASSAVLWSADKHLSSAAEDVRAVFRASRT